ncbi:MAG TPA: cysteine desulfurase [archaeon]|nr:cysteine desulfurase [archaeon]
MFDVEKIREDFPILKKKINGKSLVYLDSSATSQKPRQVIEIIKHFYENHNANVHRAIHTLGEEATEEYEMARDNVRKFINADSNEEIIFVRNSTEATNLVMYAWALNSLKKGDEIVSSVMEHHSNIVPWQFIRDKLGVKLKFVDITKDGNLKMNDYKSISKNTKMVSITHVSNTLGTINPVKEIGKIAHDNDSLFLLDGAQSVPHMPIDVKDIDCDFLVFSGHKMLGPMGIGVLYCKKEILEKIQPFMYGGDMIKSVTLEKTIYNDLPLKFEAGTSNVEGAVALSEAINYLNKLGMDNIVKHERSLNKYVLDKLSELKWIDFYGPTNPDKRGGLVAFNVKDVHSHDVAQILDGEGVAVRSGHHCTMPLHQRLGIESSARASFYIYNTKEEIDVFVDALKKVVKMLG